MKELEQALEWGTWIELAKKEASTPGGKALLGQLQSREHWAATQALAEQMQLQTQEMVSFLEEPGFQESLSFLGEPQPFLDRLRQGGILEASELAEIQRWIQASFVWKRFLQKTLPGTFFHESLKDLPEVTQAFRILEDVLTPEGEISEKASPRLQMISAEISRLKKRIDQTLDQCLNRLDQQGVLQSKFVDFREGHFVLPIKIGHHRSVKGLLREVSVSQQTFFMEPQEVEVLHRQWNEKKSDFFEETQIILKEISEKLRKFQKSLCQIRNTLCHWDAVCAKARLAWLYEGKAIEVLLERSFELFQAAHPLLWFSSKKESIVKNDLSFSSPSQVFMLTGSNTGGKTILLKTLGFAALCARTGFFFPSQQTPKIPFFDQVFLDFGDTQSMSHHVSSFSGHLLTFKNILENFQDQSLILLDELNSSTHPQEGFALSRALLETFLRKKTMIIVTTHDPQLKNLASEDGRILNASVHFDEATQQPTYRLLLGIPGKSRALEIAQRWGIPEEVLALARKYLDKNYQEYEHLLSKLTLQLQQYEKEKENYLKLQEHFESWKTQWIAENQSIVENLLQEGQKQVDALVEETRKQARLQMQALPLFSSKKQIQKSQMKWNEKLDVSGKWKKLQMSLQEGFTKNGELSSPPLTVPCLQKGDWVYVSKWKNAGTVLSVEGDQVRIALGSLQVTARVAEVRLASKKR